jgi:hypothetical protein
VNFLSKICSIFIALLFVYTINFKSFVTVSYFVNQTEIIELFCANKDKPVLQCNGKCHLATQLAEVENDTEESPFSQSNLSYNIELNLSFATTKIDIQPKMKEVKKVNYFTKKSILCDGFFSINPPPPKA